MMSIRTSEDTSNVQSDKYKCIFFLFTKYLSTSIVENALIRQRQFLILQP